MVGGLGRAYPLESTVRHAYRFHGSYVVTAEVQVAAQYRVDGGPWLDLGPLSLTATGAHEVEQRQAVITHIG
ncbi:MAG: hypothetical protein AB7L84_05065 [Acidimicrobiia bacterium]